MTTTFENAVAKLVATAEAETGFDEVRRACAVRDLRGRVGLVVEPTDALDLNQLTQSLGSQLGAWFHGPVISTQATGAPERRLAFEVLQRASRWPATWATEWSDVTGQRHPIPPRWVGYQRVISKQAWLDGPPGDGAWPLRPRKPVIVAFYSFKGGVGRTTVLAAVAWQLAKENKKVVCIDLDVEAPGLGSLMGVDSDASAVEFLLTHAATGRAPADDPVQTTNVHNVEIKVVPAGTLNRSYVEKLGRLDYLGTTGAQDSPVGCALGVLLHQIAGRHGPDYILLDCRAGIHDLGGLSLTDLAHVDVLVGRDTPQGRDGLSLTLEVLAAHRSPPARRILLVQTFVPLPVDGEAAKLSCARFRTAMYEAAQRTIYEGTEDLPSEDSDVVAHFPWPVGQLDELAACQRLQDVSAATLQSPAFTDIRRRLEALSVPETPETEEDGDDVERP